MTTQLDTSTVWQALENELFCVLGMVNARQEARTVGVVYVVHDSKLYISTGKDAWKTRHITRNPHVSITVPIAKRIPLLPWIKIPAATITFAGEAAIHDPADLPTNLRRKLYRDMADDAQALAETRVIAVQPVGDFVTYGVGVSLMEMRDTDKARGRASVKS